MTNVIYTAADGNYSLQAKVLAGSLSDSQRSHTKLVVFGNDWDPRERNRLLSLATDLLTIEIHPVPSERFEGIKLASRFPLATAYNVLAPRYLLDEEGTVLYVDADVVVLEDLKELFNLPLRAGVGACLDAHIGWVSSPTMWRPWREEGLDPATPYLNTGVMLIDTTEWNRQQNTEKCLDYLNLYELPCVDQDAINLVLRGDFTELPPRFNSMPYHILEGFRNVDLVTPDQQIGEALTQPVIIHFHRSFLGKPWERGCIHPAKELWRSVADRVHPGWRKSIDPKGYGRRRAAQFAGMLRIDKRAQGLKN